MKNKDASNKGFISYLTLLANGLGLTRIKQHKPKVKQPDPITQMRAEQKRVRKNATRLRNWRRCRMHNMCNWV